MGFPFNMNEDQVLAAYPHAQALKIRFHDICMMATPRIIVLMPGAA
jgi:hypothetical protein